jgi:hypothetical protein
VQTFLPCADFATSAAALDDRRLGKPRVDPMQVIRALTRPTYGWQPPIGAPAQGSCRYAPRSGDVPDHLPDVWPGASVIDGS